ncbi:MAG TPA: histidine kinase [Candidatus Acidoferrum sp.]|nr:histidine kinase [Candidatus Acidoferrum sp.]
MTPTRTPSFPSFWQIQPAAWTLLYVLLIVAALPHLREPAILSYNTIACAMAFSLSLLLRPVCRRVYERWLANWLVLESFAFGLSLVGGTVVTFCCQLVVFGVRNFRWSNWILSGVQLSLILFLWCSLYFSVKQWNRVNRERERSHKAEDEAREARLSALQYQLNPHFLFNALNAVSTLILEKRDEDATRMISHICDVLRTSLASDSPSLISLAEEITVVEKYLAIEQIRIGPRLTIALFVDEDVLQSRVPAKILQPLIENAVKHGISRVPGEGQITIRGHREGDRLKLLVRNTGEAHSGSGLPGLRAAGIGLTNTRQRLHTLYGSDFTLSLDWPPDGGCQVCLDLPFQRTEREDSTLCEC